MSSTSTPIPLPSGTLNSTSPSSASPSFTQVLTQSASSDLVPNPTWTANEQPASNAGGGNNNGGGSIASSAALYLYTFLATLVLLLTVSAAIVIRSFVLRRRHRRLVEEAIRNGTWVPSGDDPYGVSISGIGVNGGLGGAGAGGIGGWRGRNRVDLSSKPMMWEVYLGGGVYAEKGEGEVREWDGIKPVSASYTSPHPRSNPTVGPVGGVPVGVSDAHDGSNVLVHGGEQGRRSWVGRAGTFIADLFRPPRAEFVLHQQQQRAARANANAQQHPIVSGSDDDDDDDGGNAHDADGRQKVRVAVLIAMPRPPSSSHPRHASTSSSPNASSSSAPGAPPPIPSSLSHPLSDPTITPHNNVSAEKEGTLPVLEIGVAEVVLATGDEEEAGVGGSGEGGKSGKGRDSESLRSHEENGEGDGGTGVGGGGTGGRGEQRA